MGKVIKKLEVNIVTAFTATASPQVLARISEVLFENNSHIVRSESDRPNIHYFVRYAYSKEKEVFRICKTAERPILVFCGTRRKSEEMARDLSSYFNPDEVREIFNFLFSLNLECDISKIDVLTKIKNNVIISNMR